MAYTGYMGIPSYNSSLYVCNYGPAGNFVGQPMMALGTACSACPADAAGPCSAGLCTLSAATAAPAGNAVTVATTPKANTSAQTTTTLTTSTSTKTTTTSAQTATTLTTSTSTKITTTSAQTTTKTTTQPAGQCDPVKVKQAKQLLLTCKATKQEYLELVEEYDWNIVAE